MHRNHYQAVIVSIDGEPIVTVRDMGLAIRALDPFQARED